jgi:transposase-like protein
MRIKYSKQEISELKRNPCVFNCNERLISYTYEFKIRSLDLYNQGIKPKEIWRRSGFNTNKWRSNYFNETISDWKKIVKKNGINGLLKTDGIQYDKGPNNTDKDKLKRLELQVKYLEKENDFLAKIRAKRAESNSGLAKNTKSSKK